MKFKYLKELFQKDWRYQAIAGASLIAIIISVIIAYLIPEATKPGTLIGAVFASWLGGLFLFSVTGIVATIITLTRPENEFFDVRARNLLQRQTGPHIDYIIKKLHRLLEPYCVKYTKTLTIKDYDRETKHFKVNQESSFIFNSYIPDSPVTFKSMMGYKSNSKVPEKRTFFLSYLKINNELIFENESFTDELRKSFNITLENSKPAMINSRLTYWLEAENEPNRQSLKRFTKELIVTIKNELDSDCLTVTIKGPDNTHLIKAGDQKEIIHLYDLVPKSEDDDPSIYDFRIDLVPDSCEPTELRGE